MRFTDQVVLITGGARGQGRSHAVEFSREGADIVLVDLCAPLDVPYPSSTLADLEETRRLVTEQGRQCIAVQGDVRVPADLENLVSRTVAELGRIDILIANAGILHNAPIAELAVDDFERVVATNLGGVFNAVKAVLPVMLNQGSGRIIAISSMAGRRAYGRAAHYAASKWGIIGMIKDIALDLAPTGITANVVCPGSVDTPMAVNDKLVKAFLPASSNPTMEEFRVEMAKFHPQRVPWVEPVDISRTIMHLASDAARYVTGDVLTVSAGMMAKNSS
ncbi:mycofactocin-coupled SDR family oxidoreductase [Aeromicrobium ginsengisoli]|uniref:Mycofactocin-coupled SDR family oxidoreductase n=1 Tax=Aeromicrobium ginsengisoli TaxID=363867 RepID=A0A5M4F947_9ACTN|nr:mycofactocin-coupled SDR family oxidoreductase [Aeromicrobium ginsengisoli]KAA1394284.1 mycofactocin-coupled SDR family oxidoreductase [Aeromicrobium ginsengisoli]